MSSVHDQDFVMVQTDESELQQSSVAGSALVMDAAAVTGDNANNPEVISTSSNASNVTATADIISAVQGTKQVDIQAAQVQDAAVTGDNANNPQVISMSSNTSNATTTADIIPVLHAPNQLGIQAQARPQSQRVQAQTPQQVPLPNLQAIFKQRQNQQTFNPRPSGPSGAVLEKMRLTPVSERHVILDEEMQKEENSALLARVKTTATTKPQDGPVGQDASSKEETISMQLLAEFTSYNKGIVEGMQAVVALKATKLVTKRASISLTCVLDHSGSMAGSKMKMVHKTMHFLIDLLGPEDYLGIIIYDDEAEEALPLVRMSLGARAFAHAVVDGIHEDGSTNLYGGLVMGLMQQHEVADNKELLKSVFLCTDGLANVGPSTSEAILAAVRGDDKLQSAAMALNLHTFGFGADHDPTLLQGLSAWRDGEYYYIKQANDIPAAFADVIGGLLSVVAKEVKLDIASLGGSSFKEVKAANTVERSGNEARVQLGEVYAEESRDTLIILDLPATEADNTQVLQARLQYVDVSTGALISCSSVLELPRLPSVVHDPKDGNQVVQTTAARYVTSEAMSEAAQLAQMGDVAAANARLAQANADIGRYANTSIPSAYLVSAQATIQAVVDQGMASNQSQAMARHWSKGLAKQRMGNVGSTAPLSMNYDSSTRSQTRDKSLSKE